MVKNVVKDPLFLAVKAVPSEKTDQQDALDLLDTLRAHHGDCVGMAANMIGISKAIIAVDTGRLLIIMMNPKITRKEKPYTTQEGCLSLSGVRQTKRYQTITVVYRDLDWHEHTGTFQGCTAEIIQHECDHLEGILI